MENQQDTNATVSKVLDALNDLEGESITGARLHSLIKRVSPELNIREIVNQPVGPGALTKFIELHLSSVVRRIGMRGGDVLYGIGNADTALTPVADAGIWRAFVSPSAVNFLCLRKSDMSLFVSEFERDDEDVVIISKATDDEHDEIRSKFLGSISEAEEVKLNAHIDGDLSYDAFANALRLIGLSGRWSKFRRAAFHDLLAKRLKLIAISDDDVPAILTQFGAAQHALHKSFEAKRATTTEQSTALPSSAATPPPKNSEASHARSLAQAVIANLSYDELRAISIPFGAVLDAVRDRK